MDEFGRQLDEGKEVSSVFLIAGCDAPAVLDPVEEPLGMISFAVEIRTEADWITPIPTWRDVRPPIQDF